MQFLTILLCLQTFFYFAKAATAVTSLVLSKYMGKWDQVLSDSGTLDILAGGQGKSTSLCCIRHQYDYTSSAVTGSIFARSGSPTTGNVRYVTGTGTIPSSSAPGKSKVHVANPLDYDGSYWVMAVGSPSSQYPWAIVSNEAGTLLMVLSRPAYTKNFEKLYGKEIKRVLGSKYKSLMPIRNSGCSYV